MKKKWFPGLLLFVFSCAPSSQDLEFKAFIRSFHHAKNQQFPFWVAQAGQRDFDKTFPIPSPEKLNAELQFCKKYCDSLRVFDPTRLSAPLRFELQKIKPFLDAKIHDLEVRKIHETDPTYYNLSEIFMSFLKKKNAPDEQDLRVLESKLKQVPIYYSAAKENLKSPDPQKIEQAVEQQIQLYRFFDQQLLKLFQNENYSESQRNQLVQLAFQAKLSVKDFIAFCKSKEFDYFDERMD